MKYQQSPMCNLESTTGFQFYEQYDCYIAVCLFESQLFISHRWKHRGGLRMCPKNSIDCGGLMNCAYLTKLQGKEMEGGVERSLPVEDSKAEFESSCTVASLSGWPKGWLGQGGKFYCSTRILDQSLPSAWIRKALTMGVPACTYRQLLFRLAQMIGGSLQLGSPGHHPGEKLHQQQLNGISPGAVPFQCRRPYL